MSTLTTINDSDLISDGNEVINANFTALNNDKEEVSNKDTDTTLAANSDTKYPSQKAVKAYADSVSSPVGKSWNEYGASTTGTDGYAITISGVTAYAVGQTFKFKVDTANTDGATLNVNGLGAKAIVKAVSTTLTTNDILANMFCVCIYDGTNMVLINPRTL